MYGCCMIDHPDNTKMLHMDKGLIPIPTHSYKNPIMTEWNDGTWQECKYDAIGNLILSKWNDGEWVASEYDSIGRQTKISSSDGEVVTFEYFGSDGEFVRRESHDPTIVSRKHKKKPNAAKKHIFNQPHKYKYSF